MLTLQFATNQSVSVLCYIIKTNQFLIMTQKILSCDPKVSHWTVMMTDMTSVTKWGQEAISLYGLDKTISVIW